MPVVETLAPMSEVPVTDRSFTPVTWPVSEVLPATVRFFPPPVTWASVTSVPVSVVFAPSVTGSL